MVQQYQLGRYEEMIKRARELWACDIQQSLEAPQTSLQVLTAWGECCRFAMVAANELSLISDVRLWKSRSLVLFGRSGFSNGLALLLQSEAFAELETLGDLTVAGEIFDLMKYLIGPVPVPMTFAPEALCWRIYHERQGSVFPLKGSYRDATDRYKDALGFALKMKDTRGALKIRGSLINCAYSSAKGEKVACETAIKETTALLDDCEKADVGGDVPRLAGEFLQLMMLTPPPETLGPYEVYWPVPRGNKA